VKSVSLIVVSVLLSACDITKGGNPIVPSEVESAPPVSVGASGRLASVLIGKVWSGMQIPACPECGEGGPIAMEFSSLSPSMIVGQLRYAAQNGAIYHATVTGSVDAMAITVLPGENPQNTLCGYRASGSLNADATRIEGTFSGYGPGPNCNGKRGSFWVNADILPCTGGGTYVYQGNQHLAIYPPGWPNPEYPFSLPAVPFAIPAGEWAFVAFTGDEHSIKQDGPQAFEIVQFALYGMGDKLLGTVGPTIDVPDDKDSQESPLGTRTLTEPVVSIKAIHGYTGPPVEAPTHSVYPISLSYGCPVR